jgi:hypothetical protein
MSFDSRNNQMATSFQYTIDTIYVYCRKIYNSFPLAAKQVRKTRQNSYKFYIFDNVCILSIYFLPRFTHQKIFLKYPVNATAQIEQVQDKKKAITGRRRNTIKTSCFNLAITLILFVLASDNTYIVGKYIIHFHSLRNRQEKLVKTRIYKLYIFDNVYILSIFFLPRFTPQKIFFYCPPPIHQY